MKSREQPLVGLDDLGQGLIDVLLDGLLAEVEGGGGGHGKIAVLAGAVAVLAGARVS